MFWNKRMNLFKRRVYADAAAATPVSARSRRELTRLLSLYGNAGGLHTEGVEAKKELERARESIAGSIGAHADEIVFTASGTESNNLGVQGVFKQGHAITSAIEHQSVLEPLRMLRRKGLELTEVDVTIEGVVELEKIKQAITSKTRFVSIQLVNSEIGTIEPVREIYKILKKNSTKIYFHTDAAQAPLWLPLNVEKLGVDLLSLDGQKVLGPKGVGSLYVRRGVPLKPILFGSKQERGLRGGTENVPLIGAFAVGLHDAQTEVEKRAERIALVRDYLLLEIKKRIPEMILNGAKREERVANNANISIPGLDGEMTVIALNVEGVAVTTRSACNVMDSDPSHVIQALALAAGASAEAAHPLAKNAIRITLLPDATAADARTIAHALEIVAKRYRNVVD